MAASGSNSNRCYVQVQGEDPLASPQHGHGSLPKTPSFMRRNSSSYTVHALLISVQLCFAGWHFLGAAALATGVNPIVFALYREVLASTLMYFMARKIDGHVIMLGKHYKRFFMLGIGSFGNVVGAVVALRNISPLEFGMMQPTIPVVAMVLSFLTGVERITRLKVLGVLLCVAGAITVEYFHPELPSHGVSSGVEVYPLVGHIAVIVQVCSFASLIVLQKAMLDIYPSCTTTAWYYMIGSGLTLLVALGADVHTYEVNLTGHVMPWVALLYVVVFATFYNYNVMSYCNGQTAPTTVTSYHTLQPVFTIVFSMVLLNSAVPMAQIIGGFCVVGGLLTSTYAKKKEEEEKAANVGGVVVQDLKLPGLLGPGSTSLVGGRGKGKGRGGGGRQGLYIDELGSEGGGGGGLGHSGSARLGELRIEMTTGDGEDSTENTPLGGMAGERFGEREGYGGGEGR